MRRRSPPSSKEGGERSKERNFETNEMAPPVKKRVMMQRGTSPSWLALLPLMSASLLLASCLLLDVSYHSFVLPLIHSYHRTPIADESYNFHETYRNEFTYYDRHCSKDDLTTRNANDLLIHHDDAATVMLKHGAVAIPGILSPDVAADLRAYLANKHAEPLHYNEVFWQEMHRLSLALGTLDHPSVARALEQVGRSERVRETLEGILGPDPAVVEISTLTARSGCKDQGIHTDSDWFGSSLLYGRSFLDSYSMFIALQDTTQDLGATTVCPGSHMCADVDLEQVCLNHGAFSVSTNGKTGADEGMLYAGDGFLFNQNIWHRGPANKSPDQDRIMFILTFVSSKQTAESKMHDLRRQGLGTYYYQRWNMWGHTLSDLREATKRMVQPWAGMRALGLLPSKGGIPWIHQFAQQIGGGADFYDDEELGVMKQQLLNDKPSFLFSKSDQWKPFLKETFRRWTLLSGVLYVVTLLGTFVLFPNSKKQAAQWHIIVFLLWTGIFIYIRSTELGQSVATGNIHQRPMAPYHPTLAVEGNRHTTFPERNDVLFDTRLHSEFFTSPSRFLENHPGNEALASRIRESAGSHDPDTVVAQAIVDAMLNESELGMYRRFLEQNHTNGAWEVLNVPQAVEATRRKVLVYRDSARRETAKQLQHKLSVHRFGLHRDSLAAARAAEETQALLELELACRDGTLCVDVNDPNAPEIRHNEPHLDSVLNVGDKIWAWDEYNGKWSEAVFQGYQPGEEGQMVQFYLFSDEPVVAPAHFVRPYYRVTGGDRVLVDYNGDGSEYFMGTLMFVYPDGYCHVAFDDGEVHHYMPRSRVFLPPPEVEGGEVNNDWED